MNIPDNMIKHIGKIFNGEYDLPYENKQAVILDIGANIGGFARWAKHRWTDSTICCYEPILSNYELLVENTKDLINVFCNNVAIGKDFVEEKQMYYGLHNIGEASFYQYGEQSNEGEMVTVLAGSDLPEANIVKIDTEGSEVEILQSINFQPEVYLIEFHSAHNRQIVDRMLEDYLLFDTAMTNHNFGILKYIHKKLVNK